MGYAIVHMQKHSSGAVKGLQIHNNREKESLTNPDIDYSKFAENYDLVSCDDYSKKIADEIGKLDLKKALRKDAVYMCSFVITSDNETMLAMSDEERSSFFKDSLKFFSDRYGADNIVSATVHQDEKTPHLHLNLVPIKDGKLSANYIFDKIELKQLQTDFHSICGVKYGLERGMEDKGTKHLSELKYKIKTAEEQFQKAENNLQKYLEVKDDTLSLHQIAEIKPKKLPMGVLSGITEDDVKKLKKLAVRGIEAKETIFQYNHLQKEFEKLQYSVKCLSAKSDELDKLKRAISKTSIETQKEIESNLNQKTQSKTQSKNRSFER